MAETRNLTIMFTDIKGYTSKTSMKKREDLEKFLDLHDTLIRPIFKQFKGTVVKTIGDAFMVVFSSPTNAVLCGMKIQSMLKDYNKKQEEDDRVEVRVAINSGEVHVRGNDYFGEAVNIASRIEGIAEANEVYFTESVYLSMNKNEIPSAAIGYRKLKGIPEEIKVYKVLTEPGEIRRAKAREAKEEVSAPKKSFWKKYKGWIIGGIVLLLLIGIATNPMNIVKKESSINKFISNAEAAIKAGDYEAARKLTGNLEKIPAKDIPPKLALEGAKLYAFLRQPDNVDGMLKIARANMPTADELKQINAFAASLNQSTN